MYTYQGHVPPSHEVVLRQKAAKRYTQILQGAKRFRRKIGRDLAWQYHCSKLAYILCFYCTAVVDVLQSAVIGIKHCFNKR